MNIILICALTYVGSARQTCQSVYDEFSLQGSLTETKRWDISYYLLRGTNLNYALIGANGIFKLQQNVHEVATSGYLTQLNIVSQKPLRSKIGLQWRNAFAVLSRNEIGYDIHYSIDEQSIAPQLDKHIHVSDHQENVECTDFDYVDDTHFIVFCEDRNTTPLQYTFIVVDQTGQTSISRYPTTSTYPVITTLLMRIFNQGDSIYMFIIMPTYATDKGHQVDDSIVDVFQFDNLLVPQSTTLNLNQKVMQTLILSPGYLFRIVDLKISANSQIIILDSILAGIYLTISDTGTWQFIRRHQPTSGLYKSMDLMTDDVLITHAALFYDDKNMMIISNGYIAMNFYLDYNITWNQHPKLTYSQKYLIIEDADQLKILNFDINNHYNYLAEINKQDIQGYLLNPYIGDLIIFYTDKVSRYILSNGFLILDNPQQLQEIGQQIQLVGWSGVEECMIPIIYQIFSNTDASIYKNNKFTAPFSNIITYPYVSSYQLIFLYGMTGPNMEMKCNLLDDFQEMTIVGQYLTKLNITGLKEIPAENIQFTHMEINEWDRVSMFIYIQDNTNMLYIYYCSYDRLVDYRDCNIIAMMSQIPLTDNNFKSLTHRYHNTLTNIFAIYEDYTITIYSINDLVISSNEFVLQHIINDVSLSVDQLIVLNLEYRLITIYNLTTKQIEFTINQTSMNQIGYSGKWHPTKVQCNPQYNPTVIFIVSGIDTILLRVITDVSLIKVITLPNANTISLSILENQFLVIGQVGYGFSELREYDLRDLQNIVYTKSFPTYHYLIYEPLIMYYNTKYSTIFVMAYSAALQQTVLLVYNTDSMLRESLITVIPLEVYLEDPSTIKFAVADSYSQILYINNGKTDKFMVLKNYIQTQIKYEKEFDTVFVHDVTIQSQFYNIDSQQVQNFQQQVSFVNLNTYIFSQQQVVDKLEYYIEDNQRIILIRNDWFYGQVLEYKLECEQCNEDKSIQLEQSVHLTQVSDYGDTKFYDSCQVSFNHLTAFLTAQSILFLDSDFKAAYDPVILNIPTAYECHQIFCEQNNVIVHCKTNEYVSYIQLYQCGTALTCNKVGILTKLEDSLATKQILLIQDNLLTLGTDKNFDNSQINIYRLRVEIDNTLKIIQGPKIDKVYMDYQRLSITQMIYQLYKVNGVNIYKLFLSDQRNGLFWIDCKLNNDQILQPGFKELIDIKAALRDANLYYSQYTYVIGVVAATEVINNISEGTTESNLVIITSDIIQFGIKLVFKATVIQSHRITYVLQRYLNWQAVKATALNGHIAVLYTTNSQETAVVIYRFPTTLQENLRNLPTQIIGGFTIKNQDYQLIQLIESRGQLYLQYNSIKNRLEQRIINDFAFIIVPGQSKIQPQVIKIIAQNTFYSNSVQINLSNEPVNPSTTWKTYLIIGLIILCGMLILIGGALCYRKKSRSKPLKVVSLLE